MASFHKYVLFFSLLIALLSSIPIQARERKFFNKFTHQSLKNSVVFVGTVKNNVEEPKTAPIEAPLPAPTLAPSPTSVHTESGQNYGLYGHETGVFPPEKENATTTSTLDEGDPLNEELHEKGYQSSNNNNYNNKGYSSGNRYNNNNGYVLASESYKEGNQNEENNGYTSTTTTTNNNGYKIEKQGMSDTRFMEGGMYYYDVESENYYSSNNGYKPEKVTNENQGYYGDSEDQRYVFDTMEEYEKYEASKHVP